MFQLFRLFFQMAGFVEQCSNIVCCCKRKVTEGKLASTPNFMPISEKNIRIISEKYQNNIRTRTHSIFAPIESDIFG